MIQLLTRCPECNSTNVKVWFVGKSKEVRCKNCGYIGIAGVNPYTEEDKKKSWKSGYKK